MCKSIEEFKPSKNFKFTKAKPPSHAKEKKKILKLNKSLEKLSKLIDDKVECKHLDDNILKIIIDLEKMSKSVMETHFKFCITRAIKNKDQSLLAKHMKTLIRPSTS